MLNELSITSRSSLSPEACSRRTLDKRIGESKRQKNKQREAQRKQQQVSQAAMLDGALRALLEKHERTERVRRSSDVAAKQVEIEGHSDGGRAGEEPGRKQAHQFFPWRIVKIFAERAIQGRSVTRR